MPTTGAETDGAGDVEVVEPDAAAQMISQFLGGAVGTVTTPPLDAYGNPLQLPFATTTATTAAADQAASAGDGPATLTSSVAATPIPPYDPRPC